MSSTSTVRRVLAGLGAAGVLAASAVAGAGVAPAWPAQDCLDAKARDHQDWLAMVAALPPGSPVPPERVNPCVAEDPSYAPGASGAGNQGGHGLPGGNNPGANQPIPAPNSGPSVNAPTKLPSGTSGSPIVPIAGAQDAPAPSSLANGGQSPAQSSQDLAPVQTESAVEPAAPAPAPVDAPPVGAGPAGTAPPRAHASVGVEAAGPSDGPADTSDDSGARILLMVTGVAGALAGASKFGHGSLAGGRTPWG